MQKELRVGAQGRVVVPAELRRELGIERGQTLVARAEGQSLILEPKAAVLARLRDRFRSVPKDVSMVDELIQERRKEAERERST